MNTKFISMIFILGLLAFWVACTDDAENFSNVGNDAASKGIPNVNSTSSFSDYTIQVDVSSDGSEWTYTITKKTLASGKLAKDISHLILNLQNCGEESATFSDILYATINGQPAQFGTSEGSGTGCNPEGTTSNFVKLDGFPSANSWVIVIKYDRGYQKVLTDGWIKAGSSCSLGQIDGPGCPITEYCSYGQGRFFAEGFDNNPSIDQWPLIDGVPTLTIGGKNYNPDEANALWDANTGPGQSQEMKAFFQLGALLLSNVAPPELQDEMNTIETYFTSIPKVEVEQCPKQNGTTYDCITIPVNQAVKDAAGVIGEWIDANGCDNLD